MRIKKQVRAGSGFLALALAFNLAIMPMSAYADGENNTAGSTENGLIETETSFDSITTYDDTVEILSVDDAAAAPAGETNVLDDSAVDEDTADEAEENIADLTDEDGNPVFSEDGEYSYQLDVDLDDFEYVGTSDLNITDTETPETGIEDAIAAGDSDAANALAEAYGMDIDSFPDADENSGTTAASSVAAFGLMSVINKNLLKTADAKTSVTRGEIYSDGRLTYNGSVTHKYGASYDGTLYTAYCANVNKHYKTGYMETYIYVGEDLKSYGSYNSSTVYAMMKAAIMCGEGGYYYTDSTYGISQLFAGTSWNSAKMRYAAIHELLSMLYSHQTTGAASSVTNTLLSRLYNWYTNNSDFKAKVDESTLYIANPTGATYQPFVWVYTPKTSHYYARLQKIGSVPTSIETTSGGSVTVDTSKITLAGTEFEVYADSAHTQLITTSATGSTGATAVTDSTGYTPVFEVPGPGTYYVRESRAPNGFKLQPGFVTMTVTESNSTTDNPATASVKDWSFRGVCIITKTVKGTGEKLDGVKFGLYTTEADAKADTNAIAYETTGSSSVDAENLKVLGLVDDDDNIDVTGKAVFNKDLIYGVTYWVREISAPAEYSVDTTPKSFTVGKEWVAFSAKSSTEIKYNGTSWGLANLIFNANGSVYSYIVPSGSAISSDLVNWTTVTDTQDNALMLEMTVTNSSGKTSEIYSDDYIRAASGQNFWASVSFAGLVGELGDLNNGEYKFTMNIVAYPQTISSDGTITNGTPQTLFSTTYTASNLGDKMSYLNVYPISIVDEKLDTTEPTFASESDSMTWNTSMTVTKTSDSSVKLSGAYIKLLTAKLYSTSGELLATNTVNKTFGPSDANGLLTLTSSGKVSTKTYYYCSNYAEVSAAGMTDAQILEKFKTWCSDNGISYSTAVSTYYPKYDKEQEAYKADPVELIIKGGYGKIVWTWQETVAPDDYVLDPTVQTTTTTVQGTANSSGTIFTFKKAVTTPFVNLELGSDGLSKSYTVYPTFKIAKVDKQGNPIPGTTFIIKSDNSRSVNTVIKADENGIATYTNSAVTFKTETYTYFTDEYSSLTDDEKKSIDNWIAEDTTHRFRTKAEAQAALEKDPNYKLATGNTAAINAAISHTYVWAEQAVGDSSFNLDTSTHTTTVKGTGGSAANVSVTNYQSPAAADITDSYTQEVEILKTSPEGKSLEGAEFTITPSVGDPQDGTTDADGKLSWTFTYDADTYSYLSNLDYVSDSDISKWIAVDPAHRFRSQAEAQAALDDEINNATVTYTLTETKAPPAYEKADPVTFDVTGGTSKTTTLDPWQQTVIDPHSYGSIALQKIDSDGNTLAGVTFALYTTAGADNEGLMIVDTAHTYSYNGVTYNYIGSMTTGADGLVKWEKLLARDGVTKYLIVETSTVSGMTLLRDPIDVGTLPVSLDNAATDDYTGRCVKNEETGKYDFYDVTYTISNTVTFSVPLTGGSGFSWMIPAAAVIAAAACAAYFFTVRRKAAAE